MLDIQTISEIAREKTWLNQFHFFIPSNEILEFAQELRDEDSDVGKQNIEYDPLPISSWPPGDKIAIIVGTLIFLLERCDVLRRVDLRVIDDIGTLATIGDWTPGLAEYRAVSQNPFGEEHGYPPRSMVLLIAYTMALINEPRIVAGLPGGSRQQRRAAHRGMGFAPDAWTRVTWDLSKETVAKVSRDPTFHKVPLHWRRGHFRRAEQHFKGAMQRPDAIRAEDRELWWQWIEGQWVGHPAFGVKRSVHAPRLSGMDIARRSSA